MKPIKLNNTNINNKSGYVYLMRSDDMPDNRYKVGMTKRDPEKRAKELSTSYENNLKIIYYTKVKNRYTAEKKVFSLLKENKVNESKELIDCYDIDMIINVMKYVAEIE